MPGFGLELLLHLLVAAICGAALGLEREMQRKAAGLRTNMLIALGSALFTYASLELTQGRGDPERIAAQIVTGVGFIGAGTILHHGRDSVLGLTSAATVWVVASLGMLAGAGRYWPALGGTLLALLILQLLGRLELIIRNSYQKYMLKVEFADREGILSDIDRHFRRNQVEIPSLQHPTAVKQTQRLELCYETTRSHHERLVKDLAALPGVRQVEGRIL